MTEYFTYDDDEGFEIFTTKEEAIKRADEIMKKYKTYASENGTYDAEMFMVCWGEIKQRISMTVGWVDV